MDAADALEASESFSTMLAKASTSAMYLRCVLPHLPNSLHSALLPGPLVEGCWSVLVSNSAALAKLRQLVPEIKAHLERQGHSIHDVRLKLLKRATDL